MTEGSNASCLNPPLAGDSSDARLLHEIEALSAALSLRRSPEPSPEPSTPPSHSLWSWKSLKALSLIRRRRRRFDCRFSLHVRYISGLPSPLAGAALRVRWRRAADSSGPLTRAAVSIGGAAEFGETLAIRCSVRRTRGGRIPEYEAGHFVIEVSADGAPEFDLGNFRVDPTRLLPGELEDGDWSSVEWGTSFGLSGKARGACLNVSFGFSMAVGDSDQRMSRFDGGDRKVSLCRTGSFPGMDRDRPDRPRFLSWSEDDAKVFHELNPGVSGREPGYQVVHRCEMGALDVDSKSDLVVLSERNESLKIGNGNEEDECDEPEFVVIEQGIEIIAAGTLDEPMLDSMESEGLDKEDMVPCEVPQQEGEVSCCKLDLKGSLLTEDLAVQELNSGLSSLSIHELQGMEFSQLKLSLSLEDLTESVASEFLSMLDIEQSIVESNSDSVMEIPNDQLWEQIEEESLTATDGNFVHAADVWNESNWGDLSEDLDLPSIIRAAEMEHEKASQDMKSKLRAKMLVDAETEALIRDLDFNEVDFQRSPPGSRSGFGSPIELPPEEQPELPSISEVLRPFLQTKDG